MLTMMYNTKICEAKGLETIRIGSAYIEDFSDEDKRFLKMMDKNAKKMFQQVLLPESIMTFTHKFL